MDNKNTTTRVNKEREKTYIFEKNDMHLDLCD